MRPEPDKVKKLAIALNQDLNEALRVAGYAPENGVPSVPKPILEALAREGTLREGDEDLIADFITRLKQSK